MNIENLEFDACVQYLTQGHHIFKHYSDDGYADYTSSQVTGITNGYTIEYLPDFLEHCAFISVRVRYYSFDCLTLYTLNRAEYNPRQPLQVTIAYGLQSIKFYQAINSLSVDLRWAYSDVFDTVDMRPIIDATTATLDQLRTLQAQARAEYLAR